MLNLAMFMYLSILHILRLDYIVYNYCIFDLRFVYKHIHIQIINIYIYIIIYIYIYNVYMYIMYISRNV